KQKACVTQASRLRLSIRKPEACVTFFVLHPRAIQVLVKYNTRAKKSARARVTGPAAIFGSNFNQCKSEGTLSPNKHAVTSESAMLPPITPAARASLRQIQTMAATSPPQATPSSRAVTSSRRNATLNQRQVGRAERS